MSPRASRHGRKAPRRARSSYSTAGLRTASGITRFYPSRDSAEDALSAGSFAVGALMVISGPFFPPSLLQPGPRADTRRCAVGTQATESDCALIGAQWVVTTAGAVASGPAIGGRLHVRIGDDQYAVEQLVYHPKWNGGVELRRDAAQVGRTVPAFPAVRLAWRVSTERSNASRRHAMSRTRVGLGRRSGRRRSGTIPRPPRSPRSSQRS